jgi:hypothetical protein
MSHRAELVDVIRQIRNRWRLKLALRGVVVVAAGSLLSLLLSASGLEALRFTPASIISFRILIGVVFATLAGLWLWRPLKRQVTDAQVALYLEESDPSLEASILSAVEASSGAAGSDAHSPALVDRLVQQAVERCREVEYHRTIERRGMRRHGVMLGAVAVVAALAVGLGPAFLRHGLSALLVVYRSAEASTPYRIEVSPGTAKVPRGSDQAVKARLLGFTATEAEVRMRGGSAGAFERVPLVPSSSDPGSFEGILFHLDKSIDYYVVSNGVSSPIFTMTLVDLPTVAKLELEYRFPAYTGLPPQKIENGGDVAALRGTEVALRVVPTMNAPSGRILLNESDAKPLLRQSDGSLTGSFVIDHQGFYRIELEGPHGEHVTASPQYTIDVTLDRAPTVSFIKPGRDTVATTVEELYVEAKASDDFGIRELDLIYTVNGGREKTVRLFGGGKPLEEVSAGHTIYLEELGLQPGDSVSYYARATDTDAVEGGKTASSDIYFVQIRPFRKDFKPAQSQAQAGGGGGGGNDVGQLSQQQKEIVAATFNVLRDRSKLSAEKYREDVVFLTLSQGKLRTQVNELVEKMKSRQIDQDERFKKISDLLSKASPEMGSAETDLRKQDPKTAMTPEQAALKYLQMAEQEYELQVAAQNGGGGGGQRAAANDLADLFELELDKLANQYEMQKRAGEQQSERKIDDLADKLKELAKRQQQEAERQRRMAANGQSSGGGSSQRALADEAEEAARRLEQLSREIPRQDINDLARQLQQAADAMRRAAANGSRDGGAQAAQALEKLRQAQEQLARSQAGRTKEDIQNAQRRAEALANEQKDVEAQVRQLDQAAAARGQGQKLLDQKTAMEAKIADLEKQLQQLAEDTRRSERDASRKLDEAASSIRGKQMRDMIEYTKGLLQRGMTDYAGQFESALSSNLDALGKKIREAAGALGNEQKEAALDKALEQTRNLVRGMESLDQRMRDRTGQGQRNSQSASRDQSGRQGQQGQSGEQGQRGQQGQGQGEGRGQGRGQGQSQGQGQGRGQGQGESAQGGQGAQGNSAGGSSGGSLVGDPPPSGNGGDGRPGRNTLSAEDMRQLRRELQEQQREAEELRRALGAAGVGTRDLSEIVDQLRGLDNERLYSDPRALEQLQAAALDRLKKFEFDLRKKVGSDNNQLALSGSDEVPAGFRLDVEEYYRRLAKQGAR